MKLYTKTGDDGTTGLFGGQRVPKDHTRIAAYGSVDECNAAVGLAAVEWSRIRAGSIGAERELSSILHDVQNRLFDLGSDLATPRGGMHEAKIRRMGEGDIRALERAIDWCDGPNAALRTFILPGGGECSARLHLARTVARRAEREVLTLSRTESIGEHCIPFLNRLSDLFFAAARCANRLQGIDDVPWTPSP
ncbi:MAG: cob(I)yrinic acid a,c-diamide adenosyltransferase [Planctomycetota bacterium]|nr:cob(I)yrinic acid a,c-diamide adenosyltransferase [Planctomycetota bacterium]